MRLVSGPPVLVKRTISGSIRHPREIAALQPSAAAMTRDAHKLRTVRAHTGSDDKFGAAAAAAADQTVLNRRRRLTMPPAARLMAGPARSGSSSLRPRSNTAISA